MADSAIAHTADETENLEMAESMEIEVEIDPNLKLARALQEDDGTVISINEKAKKQTLEITSVLARERIPESDTKIMCSTPGPGNGSQRISAESVLETQDYMVYMNRAKNLKLNADMEEDRCKRSMQYLEASFYFILTGYAMENDKKTEPSASVRIYKDTLVLIRYVSSVFMRSINEESLNNKLAVISLRCQSLLSFKIFTIRKDEYRYIQSELCNYFSTFRLTGSGEATSNNSNNTNDAATIPVPSVIHSLLAKKYHLTNDLSNIHELWAKADYIISKNNMKDFFNELDRRFGPLTPYSPLMDFVSYGQYAFCLLKETPGPL